MQPAIAVAGGVGEVRKKAIRLGSAAFEWWIAELAGMLPKRWAEHLQRRRLPACVLLLNPDGASIQWTDRGRQLTQPATEGIQLPKSVIAAIRHGTVPVRLHRDFAFEAVVKLPLQAEANLNQILDHHVGLLVPLEPHEVSYRYTVATRNAVQNTISIGITIIKRQTIDELYENCGFLQLTPRSINIEGAAQHFDFIRLEPKTAVSRIRAFRRASGVAAITLVLLAFCAIEWKRFTEQRLLGTELNYVAAQASVAEGIKRRLEELADRSDFINGQLRKTPRADVFSELTRRLPTSVWLTDLHIQDDILTMSGNAASATMLIQILEASPLFTNPHFVAPIAAWEGGYEHFEIALEIRNWK